MSTSSPLRKYWKPALASGAGASVILWFEEILIIGFDLLALLGLILLAAPVYIFNHLVFKSAVPRPEDKNK
jgi:hypothetical protein